MGCSGDRQGALGFGCYLQTRNRLLQCDTRAVPVHVGPLAESLFGPLARPGGPIGIDILGSFGDIGQDADSVGQDLGEPPGDGQLVHAADLGNGRSVLRATVYLNGVVKPTEVLLVEFWKASPADIAFAESTAPARKALPALPANQRVSVAAPWAEQTGPPPPPKAP